MRVREFFVVQVSGNQKLDIELPMTFELEDGSRFELDHRQEKSLLLVIDRPVDPLVLKLETKTSHFEPLPDGGKRELPAIRVPPGGNIRAIDVTAALTFLTDISLAVNTSDRELVPGVEEDHAALEALGTKRVHTDITLLTNTRTFNPKVNADAVQALIPKTAGLRLYADAVALPTDVAKFRELWRCLESAFGMKGIPLIAALASYAPAQELGFDKKELRSLHTLRGQVSHAESKVGLQELLRVGDQASKRVPRLKCLVERVILTKRTWGAGTVGVDELVPAVGWINRDGDVELRPMLIEGDDNPDHASST